MIVENTETFIDTHTYKFTTDEVEDILLEKLGLKREYSDSRQVSVFFETHKFPGGLSGVILTVTTRTNNKKSVDI